MPDDRTVLFLCHNHPALRPGGAETYALELHHAMRGSGTFRPVFVACATTPDGSSTAPHAGTLISAVDPDAPDQYFLHVGPGWDHTLGTSTDKRACTRDLRELLEAHRPDVVHVQHTLHLGYDALRMIRTTLPDAVIVHTLHEYLPICRRSGQMVRTNDGGLCHRATPDRCHACFPEISPAAFRRRERFIRSHLDLVDRFVAPSAFLRARYIAWGIPPERILLEDYGRLPMTPEPEPGDAGELPRNRLAYFGQFTSFKGADVLLEAALALMDQGVDVDLRLHGANLEMQRPEFQARVAELLESAGGRVTMAGSYAAQDRARLLAAVDWVIVPSIWWENSPLVIQEAFAHGRPVICSDIGGMAEKVTHGVDGLHFRVGDPVSLARTIRRACETPGLWDRLRAGIRPVHDMTGHVGRLCALYDELLAARRADAVMAG